MPILLTSNRPQQRQSPHGQESTLIRIGTWNVEYADESKLPALSQVLASNQADIWVLTETHDALVPPGSVHVVHSLPRPKNWWRIRPGSRWVSIWSRFPMSPCATAISDPERTVAAIVDCGHAGSLIVYGTVMPWRDDRQIAGWAEHHRVIPMQCSEWYALQVAHPSVPLCVAGDWNTDMDRGRRYGTVQGINALRTGLDKCGLFCCTDPTHTAPGMLPVLPIDHIALPASWQTKARVASAWPADKHSLSDHSGIVVEVRI